jgi:MFS family permease
MRTPGDAIQETKLSYAGWSVVAAAISGVMVGYAVLIPYTFSLFLKPLCSSFGWRRDQVAIAFGCIAFTVAICAPAAGWLLDRVGLRRTILPCTIVFGTTIASLSLLTPSLTRFYMTFIFLGLVANGTTQLAYSRAVSSWFLERRGMALALVSAGAGLGSILLPLLAAWLIQHHGWRVAYGDLGLLVVAFSVPLAAIFLRENPARDAIVSLQEGTGGSFRSSYRSMSYLLLVGAILLYSISFNAVISHFAPLLTDRGNSERMAAEALSLMGICGFLGRLVTGYLLDRFFAPRVSLILFLATFVAMMCLCIESATAAFASAALLGFAAGGESDITPYLISRYFGLDRFSSLYGFAWTAFATGTAIGPFLMGRLYTLFGSYRASSIALLAAPAFLSAVLMMFMPPYPNDAVPSAGSAPMLIPAREQSFSDLQP